MKPNIRQMILVIMQIKPDIWQMKLDIRHKWNRISGTNETRYLANETGYPTQMKPDIRHKWNRILGKWNRISVRLPDTKKARFPVQPYLKPRFSSPNVSQPPPPPPPEDRPSRSRKDPRQEIIFSSFYFLYRMASYTWPGFSCTM